MNTTPNERPAKRTPPPVTPVDLTDLKVSIDSAEDRERPIFLAAVSADGRPAISIRGSLYVYDEDRLALWVRKQQGGFVDDIAVTPAVMLTYYDPAQGPDPAFGARRLVIEGRAHIEPDLNDEVYAAVPQFERDRDPERKGVAAIIDVDSVVGVTGRGQVNQRRGR